MSDLQRRLTQMPTPVVKQGRAGEVNLGATSDVHVPPIPKSSPNQLRKHRATGNQRFPINLSNSFIEKPAVSEPPVKRAKHTDRCSPWERYHKFMMLEQAGPVTIAHSKFSSVAIKESNFERDNQIDDIILITNSYIVNLNQALLHDGSVYLVYECMDIALRNIRSCPKGDLNTCEIAAVCKEVITLNLQASLLMSFVCRL